MKAPSQGGFLISKIHQTGGRIFARMLREHQLEINPAQGRVLYVLWEEGPMTIFELAKKVSLGKSTLTNTLDNLEESGQIRRRADSTDKRKTVIELTPKNNALQKIYEKVSLQMTEIYYRGFTREEMLAFEKKLSRILDNLASEEQKAEKQ